MKETKIAMRKTDGGYFKLVLKLDLRKNVKDHKMYTNLWDVIVWSRSTCHLVNPSSCPGEGDFLVFGKTLPPIAPVNTHLWLWGCPLLF